MDWILLTNDDGIDSPALVPLAEALQSVAELRVVVPDRERSWVGKAITRHDPVTVAEVERGSIPMLAASGFPADCVQLGVNSMFSTPPRLVVSGINIGYNHGAGYIQSSGTVGAAMEALLAGMPAAAFSAGSRSRPWAEWKTWVNTDEAATMWRRLAGIATAIVSRLLEAEPPGSVVNVNLPDDSDSTTPRRITSVAHIGYDRLFTRSNERTFVHDYGGGLLRFAGLEGTDVEAAQHGHVAITPVSPMGTGVLQPELAAALSSN